MVGTITDPEHERLALGEIGRAIKERFELPISGEEIWRYIDAYRRPFMDSRDRKYILVRDLISDGTERLLKRYGRHVLPEDRDWLHELYVRSHEENCALSRNALEGMKMMREIGYLGIITDADTDYAFRVLRSLGVLELFDSVTTSEEVGVGKPNPHIFAKALEKAGKKETAFHIGDSERRDVKGARISGLVPVLISDKKRNTDAEYVAKDLLDAAGWVAEYRKNL